MDEWMERVKRKEIEMEIEKKNPLLYRPPSTEREIEREKE